MIYASGKILRICLEVNVYGYGCYGLLLSFTEETECQYISLSFKN